MAVFMQDNRTVEIAVTIRRCAGEYVHLHAPGLAIGRSGKIRVVGTTTVLGIGLYGVVPLPATTEIVVLEVASRLSEAELIEPIVRDVAPVKKIGHGRTAIGRRRLAQVERKIERPRIATAAVAGGERTWRIRDVIKIEIGMGIDVVAARVVIGVDPAVGRSGGVQAGQLHQGAGDGGGLGLANVVRPTGRQRCWAVTSEDIQTNGIGCLGDGPGAYGRGFRHGSCHVASLKAPRLTQFTRIPDSFQF